VRHHYAPSLLRAVTTTTTTTYGKIWKEGEMPREGRRRRRNRIREREREREHLGFHRLLQLLTGSAVVGSWRSTTTWKSPERRGAAPLCSSAPPLVLREKERGVVAVAATQKRGDRWAVQRKEREG
jgi:hypothetical protein